MQYYYSKHKNNVHVQLYKLLLIQFKTENIFFFE